MKRSFPNKQIKNHLENIKKSIQNDVGQVLPVYAAKRSGFFAVPRMLFPEIDGLGSFLTGNANSTNTNITTYFKKIMSEIDSRYAKYGAFITVVYRHGLLHQHSPKRFEYKGKDVGWIFSMSSINNPLVVQRRYHLDFLGGTLQINMNVFYQDVVDSIDILYKFLKSKGKENFSEAIFQQSKPLNKTSFIKNKNFSKQDFNFFKDLDF